MKRTLPSTLVAGALAAGIAVPAGAAPVPTFYYNAYGGFVMGSDVDSRPRPFTATSTWPMRTVSWLRQPMTSTRK